MKATLHNTASITVDLDVRRITWATLAGRRFGEALVHVPRGHAAFSSAYIAERGGSRIVIEDKTLGVWEGIAQEPAYTETGIAVRCDHLAKVMSIRPAPLEGTYQCLTAGALVQIAAMHAVAGLGGSVLRIGSITESAPVIESYSFSGQPLSDVIGDLQERTGQEARVADGVLSWGAPAGARYSAWLVTGGNLRGATWTPKGESRIAEVIAVGTGTSPGRYRTRDGAAAASAWPRVSVLRGAGSPAVIAQRAEALLSSYRRTPEEVRGWLAEANWTIREGDVVTVLDASAGFGGRVGIGRVMSRTWEPGRLSVEIQVVEDAMATGVEQVADSPSPVVGAWSDLARRLARVRGR